MLGHDHRFIPSDFHPVPTISTEPPPTKTIAQLVTDTPNLSTLLTAVKAADLVDTLSGEGPFTVFAPINKAFAKFPQETLSALLTKKDDLSAVLLRHVVPAKLRYADVPMGKIELETAGGDKIMVNKNNLGITIKSDVGDARVYLTKGIAATNGVIHLVNNVF